MARKNASKSNDGALPAESRKEPRRKPAEKKSASAKGPPQASSLSAVMLHAGLEVVQQCRLRAMLLYVDGLVDADELQQIPFDGPFTVILIVRSESCDQQARNYTEKVVRVPPIQLTRNGQIKMAVMLAFSKRLLRPGDRFVFLTGLSQGKLDTMIVMEVGREYEMFQSVDQPPLTEHIRRAVFERVLNLALELAAEGREGKPSGAIFVLGDSAHVLENTRQNIINPFKGYPEQQRNILDDAMTETVKEFSSIDGAFVIKGTGTIVSAGTYLLPKLVPEELPQGLGARHAAAAAITAATKSIAITISESTGTVRIWRQGKLITEIEKAKPSSTDMVKPESP
ncbi:MAG: diadenylate cyclase [Sedimentisphaerales bacterium]|nr:diadenylate cyclase [Sedimentisphaerales bacterium]